MLFRSYLAENAHLDGAGIDVLLAARRIIAREEHTAIVVLDAGSGSELAFADDRQP